MVTIGPHLADGSVLDLDDQAAVGLADAAEGALGHVL